MKILQRIGLGCRVVFGSQTLKDAEWELNFVFGTSTSGKINVQPEPPVKTTYHPNVSLCLIKPHALRQSLTGRIIQDIHGGKLHVLKSNINEGTVIQIIL